MSIYATMMIAKLTLLKFLAVTKKKK